MGTISMITMVVDIQVNLAIEFKVQQRLILSFVAGEMDPNQIFQAFFGGPSMFRMGNMGGGMGGMGGGGMGGHCPGSFNFQFG